MFVWVPLIQFLFLMTFGNDFLNEYLLFVKNVFKINIDLMGLKPKSQQIPFCEFYSSIDSPSLPSSLVNTPVSLSELLKLLLLGAGAPRTPDTSIGCGGGASRRLRRVRALAVSSRTCACGVANPIARGDSVRTLRLRLPQLVPVTQNLLPEPVHISLVLVHKSYLD